MPLRWRPDLRPLLYHFHFDLAEFRGFCRRQVQARVAPCVVYHLVVRQGLIDFLGQCVTGSGSPEAVARYIDVAHCWSSPGCV